MAGFYSVRNDPIEEEKLMMQKKTRIIRAKSLMRQEGPGFSARGVTERAGASQSLQEEGGCRLAEGSGR